MTPMTIGRIINHKDVDPLDRLIWSLDELRFVVNMLRQFEIEICLTSGSFDLAHIGHSRYTRKGWREVGNNNRVGCMLVAIEDDEKVSKRKGPHRPVIPLIERAEFMASTRWVDILVVKKFDYPKWEVAKIVKPDVLLAVEGTYTPEEVVDLEKICGRVFVAPRQAQNSTSAQVRRIQLGGADELIKTASPLFVANIGHAVDDLLTAKQIRVLNGVGIDQLKDRLIEACEGAIDSAYKHVSAPPKE